MGIALRKCVRLKIYCHKDRYLHSKLTNVLSKVVMVKQQKEKQKKAKNEIRQRGAKSESDLALDAQTIDADMQKVLDDMDALQKEALAIKAKLAMISAENLTVTAIPSSTPNNNVRGATNSRGVTFHNALHDPSGYLKEVLKEAKEELATTEKELNQAVSTCNHAAKRTKMACDQSGAFAFKQSLNDLQKEIQKSIDLLAT